MLNDILLEIYQCFLDSKHKPWEQLSLTLEKTGKFNVHFNYDSVHASNRPGRCSGPIKPSAICPMRAAGCGSSWYGEYPLDFGGTICSAEILIRSEDEIAESQRDAFRCFVEKWPDLNEKLIQALIGYYNNEERFSYGPDSEEEMSAWWPEIETKEALSETETAASKNEAAVLICLN